MQRTTYMNDYRYEYVEKPTQVKMDLPYIDPTKWMNTKLKIVLPDNETFYQDMERKDINNTVYRVEICGVQSEMIRYPPEHYEKVLDINLKFNFN